MSSSIIKRIISSFVLTILSFIIGGVTGYISIMTNRHNVHLSTLLNAIINAPFNLISCISNDLFSIIGYNPEFDNTLVYFTTKRLQYTWCDTLMNPMFAITYFDNHFREGWITDSVLFVIYPSIILIISLLMIHFLLGEAVDYDVTDNFNLSVIACTLLLTYHCFSTLPLIHDFCRYCRQ